MIPPPLAANAPPVGATSTGGGGSSGGGGGGWDDSGGPLSNMSVLWEDNKQSVFDLLRLGPNSNKYSIISDDNDEDEQKQSSSPSNKPVEFKQRLIFSDEKLRNIVMRNVLRDPSADGVAATSASIGRRKKQQKQRQKMNRPTLLPQDQILGVSIPPNFGIVGVQVLVDETTLVERKINSHLQGGGTSSNMVQPNLSTSQRQLGVPDFDSIFSNTATVEDFSDGAQVFLYICRPTPSQATLMSQRIKSIEAAYNASSPSDHLAPTTPGGGGTTTRSKSKLCHRIIFMPYCTSMCKRVLMDEGVLALDNVHVHELHLDLIPLDNDLVSMETPSVLKECYVDGIPSYSVSSVARAIMKLQDLTGSPGKSPTQSPIPHLQGIGPMGEAVVSHLFSLRMDEYTEEILESTGKGGGGDEDGEGRYPNDDNDNTADYPVFDVGVGDVESTTGVNNTNQIEALLVIDRKVDMVTPLLTPLTYEGLIDDVVGLQSGYVEVDESLLDPTSGEDDGETKENDSNSTNPFDDVSGGCGGGTNDHDMRLQVVLGKLKRKPRPPPRVAVALNGTTDKLFAEVRAQHVEQFGSFLQDQAKALKERHSNFTTQKAKSADLTRIHEFVKSIPLFTQNLRSLTLQIHLAEQIKAHTQQLRFQEQWHTERSMLEGELCYELLEDLLLNETLSYDHADEKKLGYIEGKSHIEEDSINIYQYLRLICLQSLTSGGLRPNKFDSLRKDVVQTFGYEYLFTLNKLEKLGLLKKREGSYFDSGSSFSTLRKLLNLIHAEVNNIKQDDISYVSSGYAPLSVRLVQQACSGGTAGGAGWRNTKGVEILKELPGRMVHVLQRNPPEEYKEAIKSTPPPPSLSAVAAEAKKKRTAIPNSKSNDSSTSSNNNKPIMVVFYVGGISLMEIASLRWLSQRSTSFPYQIVIGTTNIINGKTLLLSLDD